MSHTSAVFFTERKLDAHDLISNLKEIWNPTGLEKYKQREKKRKEKNASTVKTNQAMRRTFCSWGVWVENENDVGEVKDLCELD